MKKKLFILFVLFYLSLATIKIEANEELQNNHLGYTINLGKDGYIKTNQIYTQNPIFELDWIENQRKNAVKTNINEKVEYNLTSYTFKELIEKKNEKFSFNSDINLDLNPYNIYI